MRREAEKRGHDEELSSSHAARPRKVSRVHTRHEKRSHEQEERDVSRKQKGDNLRTDAGALMNHEDRSIISGIMKGCDISEVFLLRRVKEACMKPGFPAGLSMDLQTCWDFDLSTHRREATRRILERRPHVACGPAPMHCVHEVGEPTCVKIQ